MRALISSVVQRVITKNKQLSQQRIDILFERQVVNERANLELEAAQRRVLHNSDDERIAEGSVSVERLQMLISTQFKHRE